MTEHLLWTFGSVILVSLMAFIGALSLALREDLLHRVVFALVSFAAGALFGGAFLHLLPRSAAEYGFTTATGLYLLSGLVAFFIIDKYVHWHHHHFREEECEECVEPVTYMILLGDGFHNVIDGIVIAASYLASVPTGIAATLAVILHEIPQEIGDFGVLVHGGFSVRRALFYNFVSALTAVVGAAAVILAADTVTGIDRILLPFAAGGFIYIAGTDLLPEFKEETDTRKATIQTGTFLIGLAVMYGLKIVIPAVTGAA